MTHIIDALLAYFAACLLLSAVVPASVRERWAKNWT